MIVDQPENLKGNPHLTTEKRTPLEERLLRDKPELGEALGKLKASLDEEIFHRAFDEVENINRSGSKLLIVARNPLARSFIERDAIPALKEAFEVTRVQIIG